MIGDTEADLKFAAAIQADACWASYGEGDPVACKALNPRYMIRRFTEIKKWF